MLTDLKIKNLPIPAKRQETPDGKVTGLYLIRQPSGARSWAVRYRAAGKPSKLTLGSYPAVDLATARKRAQEALGAIAGGKDLGAAKKAGREAAKAERNADDRRVERVFEQHVERHVKRNVGAGWGAEVSRLFLKEIAPRIGSKSIGDVTKADIKSIVGSVAARGLTVAPNRVLAVLKKFFNWAVEEDFIAASPCQGVKMTKEASRERVLSDDEIRLAWTAFEAFGWPQGAIGKLLLLTGARRSEIAEARWQEIDLAAATLTLPGSRTKNGAPHVIPLSDAAVEIIKALPQIEGTAGYVFTASGRSRSAAFPVSWSRCGRRAKRRGRGRSTT